MKLAEKVIHILNEKSSLPDKYADNDVAMAMIKDEIDQMRYEIEQSEKGQRSGFYDTNVKGQGMGKWVNTSTKSTFPDYLQHIFNNAGTKKKFLGAVKRGKGKVWDRIALVAIQRLEHGYKNIHGYDEPNQDFIDVVANPLPF